MFDSTTYPDSDLIAKLEILSQKDYLRNTLEVSLSLLEIVSRSKIPNSLQNIILNAWVWCIPKIKNTFTDEVVLAWKFANQNRSLSNFFTAARVTVATTRAWLAN